MAYVRKRGRQVAIVHGRRDPSTGNVEQRVLFVFYSQTEVRDALGQGPKGVEFGFKSMLQEQYPQVRFDWKKIRRGIEAVMGTLPETYAAHEGDRRTEFRRDLGAFARRLILTHPQESSAAAGLLREHWIELEYMVELIQGHLKLAQDGNLKYWKDDASRWRWQELGSEVPPDAEEHAVGFYERRELDRAEAIFKLLVECFGRYAEGYNYLGLIALQRGRLKDASAWFRKTVEVGRNLFPRKMGRSRYWTNLSTRPYMRGLRNLAYTLTALGHYEEALAICDLLDRECGDDITAASERASVFLGQGRWAEAAEAAGRLVKVCPSEDFIAAFALAELRRWGEALGAFLHGALNHPYAAPLLTGKPFKQPKNYEEQEDSDMAKDWIVALKGYFSRRSPDSRRFFVKAVAHPQVRALVEEVKTVRQRWSEQKSRGDRSAYDRLMEMQSLEFAQARAGELADLAGIAT